MPRKSKPDALARAAAGRVNEPSPVATFPAARVRRGLAKGLPHAGGAVRKPTRSGPPLALKTSRWTAFYDATPLERIAQITHGVPAALFRAVATELRLTHQALADALGISRATVDRKLKGRESLNAPDGEALLSAAQLIGQVQRIVEESGDATGFDAGTWVAAWMTRRNAALGDERPCDLMHTGEGRALVEQLVSQMQSGSYA